MLLSQFITTRHATRTNTQHAPTRSTQQAQHMHAPTCNTRQHAARTANHKPRTTHHAPRTTHHAPRITTYFLTGDHWQSISNRRKFFVDFATTRGLDPLTADAWYSVSRRDVATAKVKSGFSFFFLFFSFFFSLSFSFFFLCFRCKFFVDFATTRGLALPTWY
jgi:hypothetical protein